MKGFDPLRAFGDEVSRRYDTEDTRGDEEETVAFLAKLAGGQAALEFAVGTGRIALPLTRAGTRVDGIELSPDMVARMRETGRRPRQGGHGGHGIGGYRRKYRLVYLIYNTIGVLLTQDDQVRCFQNAARHMTDDGLFVLEVRVPTAPGWADHQHVRAERIEMDHVVLEAERLIR